MSTTNHIREVVTRYRLPRREFEERFPDFQINPLAGLATVEIEEVYRLAEPDDEACAMLLKYPTPGGLNDWERYPLVLRGVRLASGRWLTQQNLPPQQAPDAEPQAPGSE